MFWIPAIAGTYKLKQVLKDIIENGWINYHLEDE